MATNSIDWSKLGCEYFKTDYNVRSYFKDGKWSDIEVTDSEYLPMHIAAGCLHYGQEAFEGLKVFRGCDGKAYAFRIEENAKRLQRSAEYICMEVPPIELCIEMCRKAIKANERFIPTYGSGATLHIRPLLLGSGGTGGLKHVQI